MVCFFFAAAAVVYIVFRREEVARRGGLFANVWETIAASLPGLAVTHPPASFPQPCSEASHCKTPQWFQETTSTSFFPSEMDRSSFEIDLSRCILGFQTQQIITLQSVCLLPLVTSVITSSWLNVLVLFRLFSPARRNWFCAGLK